MATLHTERLTLGMLRDKDLDAYAELYGDPNVARFIGAGGRPRSREEAWRHLAMIVGHWHLRGYGMWAVVERHTNAVIGRIGFFNPEGWPGFELGWALIRGYWGRGFATEGARVALDHAFTTLGRDHVISVIRPDNHRSIQVTERRGKCFERATQLNGHEVHVYGISREAWSSA